MYDMVKAAAPLIGMASFKDSDESDENAAAASHNVPNWQPDPAFAATLKRSTGKRTPAAEADA